MDMEATHDIDSFEDRLDRKIRAVLGEFPVFQSRHSFFEVFSFKGIKEASATGIGFLVTVIVSSCYIGVYWTLSIIGGFVLFVGLATFLAVTYLEREICGQKLRRRPSSNRLKSE